MNDQYGPTLTAFKLYKKSSKKTGSDYFVGRWGLLKVAVLKSSDTADDGGEIWNVVLQQADEPPRQQDAKRTREDRAKANEPLRSPSTSSRPMPNDAIPF